MEKILSVAQVIAPIFTAIFLGMLAKRKSLMTPEEVRGLQQFVVKFGLPCVVFNSCLTAKMGGEALLSMGLCLVPLVIGTLWSFRVKKGKFRYHNLPQLFCAHETGMLGIPLTITLFGAAESYRMGVLDLTQAIVAYPVIAILSTDTGENPSLGRIVKGVLCSPLVIMSALGLTLNLTGAAAWMDSVGIGSIVTESVGFLAEPVSAVMLFSVGYNFSMDKSMRGDIFRVSGIHVVGYSLAACVASQIILAIVPGVDAVTKWVMLLYCVLPASYLAPGLGRKQADYTLASGVCSVLTVVTLVVFCVICAFVA